MDNGLCDWTRAIVAVTLSHCSRVRLVTGYIARAVLTPTSYLVHMRLAKDYSAERRMVRRCLLSGKPNNIYGIQPRGIKQYQIRGETPRYNSEGEETTGKQCLLRYGPSNGWWMTRLDRAR